MSIKRNILASYAGQIYITLTGIVLVPLYIQYMGAEAYGLVGFYTMLQAWFQLLDMGLSTAMTREAARFQGGAVEAQNLRRLLRTLELIFLAVALAGALAMAAEAGYIAREWLKVQHLQLEEVRNAVMLMAMITALRLMSGPYRGVINGFEKLVWLSGLNVAMATARFILVVPFLLYVGVTPTLFFGYQLGVASVETLLLLVQAYRLMPGAEAVRLEVLGWGRLREVFKFSLGVFSAVLLYLLGTQADKLLLSNFLALADYGYYTLAALVASGVMMLGTPASAALVPRMTALNAVGNEAGMTRTYRNATQIICVIAIPATLILALFPEQVLWVWTGNPEIASKAKPVLTLYALAYGLQVIGAITYSLQLAKGDLRLHVLGTGIYSALLVPMMIWGVTSHGAVGAGYAFLATNALFFIFWVPLIHGRLARGLHAKWLAIDVAVIAAFAAMAALALDALIVWPSSRFGGALAIVAAGIFLCGVAATGSSYLRGFVASKLPTQFFR